MYRFIEQVKRMDFSPFATLQVVIDNAIAYCESSGNQVLKQKLLSIRQEVLDIINMSIPFEGLNERLFDNIKSRLILSFEASLYLVN